MTTLIAIDEQAFRELVAEVRALRQDLEGAIERGKKEQKSNWITTGKAARLYNMSVTTVRRKVKNGEFKSKREGKLIYVFYDGVDIDPGIEDVTFRDTPRHVTQYLRKLILDRDGNRCTYCNATDGPFEIDHILPYSRGGETTRENLCVSCVSCNRDKGSKTVDEWREG